MLVPWIICEKIERFTNGLTHSSSTKKRTEDRSSLPVEIRSSRRPGVATTMSTCQQHSKSTNNLVFVEFMWIFQLKFVARPQTSRYSLRIGITPPPPTYTPSQFDTCDYLANFLFHVNTVPYRGWIATLFKVQFNFKSQNKLPDLLEFHINKLYERL